MVQHQGRYLVLSMPISILWIIACRYTCKYLVVHYHVRYDMPYRGYVLSLGHLRCTRGSMLPTSRLCLAVGAEVHFVLVPTVLPNGDMSYLRYALHREVK